MPQPSQADSDSTAASDEEQIDVFQALDALNRSEKKEVTKDEQQIDLLEALEEQRRLQEKISVYQMLSESPPKTVNHPEKRPDEATTQPSARPDESALTPDRQRDKLFDAVRHGDTKHANWMVKELSFTNPLDKQLPAAIPDTFIQNTWTPAQRHFSKFSTPLQMYLTHCRQIATWHQWVREVLPQHTDVNALFSPALQGACDVLRTTREAQLEEKAGRMAHKLGAALGEPQLEQALARQPFTSIQAMRNTCTLLERYLDNSSALAAFRNALDVAFALQHHATEKLRLALLNDTLDEGSLKPLPMMVFARQVTTLPAEDLATRTTPKQRTIIHQRLGILLKDAMGAEDSGRRWEVTVLKRLTIQAEKATLKKTGLVSDHSGVTDDDDDDD